MGFVLKKDDHAALVLQTASYLRGIPRPTGRSQLQTMLCTAQYTRVLPMPYADLAKGTDGLFLMDYSDHGLASHNAGPVAQLHSTAVKHPPSDCVKGAAYGNLPGMDGLLDQVHVSSPQSKPQSSPQCGLIW